jgi:hypothetical protein
MEPDEMAGCGSRRAARAWILLVALVAACGPGPQPSPPVGDSSALASAAAAPSPNTVVIGGGVDSMPTPPGSPLPAAVPAAEAWGAIAPRHLDDLLPAGRHFVFDNAGTPDGEWLIGTVQPDGFPTDTSQPSYAVLYGVTTGEVRRMAELASHASQILWAGADERWVVWSEAPDQPNFYDWVVRAYDRRTRTVRELARAATVGGQAVQGPEADPSVSYGLAVWGQATGAGVAPGQLAQAAVRQADLATGAVSTLATSALSPSISLPWVSWFVSTGNGTGYVRASNRETGQTVRVDQVPPTFVLDGASAAYNDPQSLSVWLIDDLASGAAREIARGADATDHLEWITLNPRIVAWSQSAATQVYDRAEQRLVSLPLATGRSAVYVCGPLIVWAEQDPAVPPQGWPDRPVVLDSSTLPVRP